MRHVFCYFIFLFFISLCFWEAVMSKMVIQLFSSALYVSQVCADIF